MAELAGMGGTFLYNTAPPGAPATAIAGIGAWTLSYQGDAHDTTNFADATTGRAFVKGISGWTGTATGYYDSTSASVIYDTTLKPGTSLEARFQMRASKHATGEIIVTGINFNTGIDGAVTAEFTFQGTGSLAIV